ncbi:MAG: hypothetical protein ACK4F9_03060 [Brevinematia bacterium]
MISIIGINDISIQLHKKIPNSILIGPYKEKLSSSHKNESITYVTIHHIVPNDTRVIIDLTFNRITSLLINDFSLEANKKLISTLYWKDEIIIKNVSKYSCVRCLYNDSENLVNYLIIKSSIRDQKTLIDTLLRSLEENKSYRIYLDKIEESKFEKGCPSCVDKKYKFLEGEYGEMINENCNENSVAVFPIDDRNINIKFLRELFSKNGVKVLEENDEYLIFMAEDRKMFLFRNGRLIISDKTTKEEAEYLYRNYIGS